MKKNQIYYLTVLYIIILTISSCNIKTHKKELNEIPTPSESEVGINALPSIIAPISAPFKMKSLQKPTFKDNSINILKKGAKSNILITTIIQNCINEISNSGGGTVIIPKGKWMTGRIILKSNVNLHFEDGAELQFSGEIKDYQPAVFTRIEGIEVMSLGACIYAEGQENIAITGKGVLLGPAKGPVRTYIYSQDVIENIVPLDKPVSERNYSGINGEGYFLPMFISPINCTNVFIEGISLKNTAFWNIVPIYCKNVIIRGVQVQSVGIQRGDGIDIESSKNVLIEYCNISSGDDCFTIKAGRGEDGIRVNRPTENVVIRYCLALEGHGGITCGSETAGMIRNLYVHDCVFQNTGVGIRFKTRRPRGGGGENLCYERIKMSLKYTAFKWDMLGSTGSVGKLAERLPKRDMNSLTPKFRNIEIKDIIIENSTFLIKVIGIPESPLENLHIENVKANCTNLISAYDMHHFTLKNAFISTTDSILQFTNCTNVNFTNTTFKTPNSTLYLHTDSVSTDGINFRNSWPEIIKESRNIN